MELPDVDLDVGDREKAMNLFPDAVQASQLSSDKRHLVAHNTGLYFQQIPTDPDSGFATFPYDVAEELEYYKIDIIPYHVYEDISDEAVLLTLLERAEGPDFPWEWFQQDRFFTNSDARLRVTHLAKHQRLCRKYPPRSVEDVAVLNALIRPRKKYLIGRSWVEILENVWVKHENETGYFFKKSHAVAFALVILVHMQVLDLNV